MKKINPLFQNLKAKRSMIPQPGGLARLCRERCETKKNVNTIVLWKFQEKMR